MEIIKKSIFSDKAIFQSTELIKLTSNKNYNRTFVDSVFSLEKLKLQKFGQCVEHLTLDENDDIFDNVSKEKLILIEHKTSHKSSQLLCQSYGGLLFTPKALWIK